MSRYRIELATRADDADLRRILAETPMEGAVAIGLRREPSFFDAAVVAGPFQQVLAAREGDDGHLVGFGARSVRPMYVNGEPKSLGYLSSLRVLEAHRGGSLVARGYRYFRQLHADGRAAFYLTTIAEKNTTAISVLTSGRGGLPPYHYDGRYHSVAIPLRRRPRRPRPPRGLEIRPAEESDLPIVQEFLAKEGPRRQFFPCYEAGDFFGTTGALRDLRAEDLLLAFRGDALVGTLAGWDQHGFRQTVVKGYAPALRLARPWFNAWARVRGLPTLPDPGEELRSLTAALPVAAGDDTDVFAALLAELLSRAAGGPHQYLLVGLHESDPLFPVLRRWRATRYVTHLYLVCWPDGEAARAALDDRPRYLELGSL